MNILSKIKRRNGHTVTLDGVTYSFLPPVYIANVTEAAHIERFLAVPEGYGIAGQADPAPAPAKTEQDKETILLGSDVHPSAFDINGTEYSLGQVVQLAFAASGLNGEAWNNLSEGERADLIDEQLDALAGEPLEGDLNGDGDLDREELAKLYEAKFDKRPHGKWNADRIRAELDKDAQ